MTIGEDIDRRGGLAATHELRASGWGKRSLALALTRGDIVRVRQGWYARSETDPLHQQAVRVGGRLGCISAARLHGIRVRASANVHVAVAAHTGRLRSKHDKNIRLATLESPGVVTHWCDTDAAGSRFAVGPRECLREMLLCQSPEWTVAAADSALQFGFISREEWEQEIANLPRRLRRLLATADGRAESITESVTRFRLQQLGLSPRLQVQVAGVGRVDLMIGERLVIEIDGYRYHSDPEAFEADRRRDARLSMRGYRVLRFSYKQVMERWHEVRASILAAVARGDHLI